VASSLPTVLRNWGARHQRGFCVVTVLVRPPSPQSLRNPDPLAGLTGRRRHARGGVLTPPNVDSSFHFITAAGSTLDLQLLTVQGRPGGARGGGVSLEGRLSGSSLVFQDIVNGPGAAITTSLNSPSTVLLGK
jgi:hypothetical protein